MRKQLCKVAAVCVLGFVVSQGLAQPAEGGRQRGNTGGYAERAKAQEDRLFAELKLTAEKEAQVRQILATNRQEMATWFQQNGPEMRKLMEAARGARGEEPSAEAKEAREKLAKLTAERTQKQENLFAQLKDVLTAEQLETAKRILGERRGGPRGPTGEAALAQLGLSDEQKAKAKAIMDAAKEAVDKETEARAKARLQRDAWEQVVKEVLTDEQRKKLETLRTAGPPAGPAAGGRQGGPRDAYSSLNLTDQQKESIQKIMDAARAKMGDSTDREARMQIFRDARQEISDKVLTEEQRKEMEKARAARGAAAGGRRNPGGANE